MVIFISKIYLISERKRKKKKQRKEEKNRYISEEVLEEILVRLPVKSLYKFKSVSKTWRSLIESRSFMDFHTGRHSRDHSDDLMFSQQNDDIMAWMDLEQEECGPMVHAMGPLSNGIYCLISITTGKIALCNRATNNYKLVNPSIDSLHALAHKPCRVHYGFGNSKEDHKVIVITSRGPRFSSFLSFVYSSQRDEWRKIADYEHGKRNHRGEVQYPEITEDLELCPQRFYNGCWHWMAVHEDGTCSVLSFNLADEAFRLMGAPDFYLEEVGTTNDYLRGAWVLGLNDHLGAIFFPNPCSFIYVYMMMEYGVEESWTEIYAIEPNFYGDLSRLMGIYWKPPNDGDGNGNGGNYGIQSIAFESDHDKKWISCYDSGYKEHGRAYDLSSGIWWNTLGISAYRETLHQPF